MAFTADEPEVTKSKTGAECLQQLLKDIGGTWSKPKPKPKVLTAEEKEIKLALENSSRAWKYFQFQMGWFALEWVEPMSRRETQKYTAGSKIVM